MKTKTLQVIMLPKNIEDSEIGDILLCEVTNKLLLCTLSNYKHFNYTPQHLYLVSDIKPTINDWVIEYQKGDNIGELHQISNEHELAPDIQKKIEAATDILSKANSASSIKLHPSLVVPQIHQLNIEWYISQYNKGNIIKEIEVEVEEIPKVSIKSDEPSIFHTYKSGDTIFIIKTRSDNTVILAEQLDEEILSNDHPVYGDYLYVCDGKVIRCDLISGTVADLKRDLRSHYKLEAKEIKNCDIAGRRNRTNTNTTVIHNNRQAAMTWWNSLASLRKTQLCDTNTDVIGSVRRWESLTGTEVESIWKKETQSKVNI